MEKQNKTKMSTWKKVLILLVVLYIVGTIAGLDSDKDEAKVEENKTEQVEETEFDSAYEAKCLAAQEKRRQEYEKKKLERAKKDKGTAVFHEENPKVFNSIKDGSVAQVKSYLKENLNDPNSYEPISWTKVVPLHKKRQYSVIHKYRARNGFGALMIYKKQFILDPNGNVVDIKEL